MINYLKLLIKNINTGKKAWFPYPFDMDEIRKTLHLKDNEYKIINYNSSMPIYLRQFTTIGIIEEDYEKYLSLPDYIRNNIDEISDVVGDIEDIVDAITKNKVTLYPNCKNEYDLAREMLKQRNDIPNDVKGSINLNSYIYDTTMNSDIIKTPDGIIVIKYEE